MLSFLLHPHIRIQGGRPPKTSKCLFYKTWKEWRKKNRRGGGRGGDCNVWPWKLTHLGSSLAPVKRDYGLTTAWQGHGRESSLFPTKRRPQTAVPFTRASQEWGQATCLAAGESLTVPVRPRAGKNSQQPSDLNLFRQAQGGPYRTWLTSLLPCRSLFIQTVFPPRPLFPTHIIYMYLLTSRSLLTGAEGGSRNKPPAPPRSSLPTARSPARRREGRVGGGAGVHTAVSPLLLWLSLW